MIDTGSCPRLYAGIVSN